jgi:predicted enzyme related to lactoylglutathione lyase
VIGASIVLPNNQLKLKRIDNMDILCKDVDSLVQFYHDKLGLDFFLPFEKGQDWVALDGGNITIYIFKSERGTHAPRRTPINPENPPGIDSFAFEVDNLDSTIAELDRRVVEWAGDVIHWKHPSGVWYRYRPLYDPEGNMLYVTEPHKK